MELNPLVIFTSTIIILCIISGYAAEPNLGCEFVKGYQFKDTEVNTPVFGLEMSPYPVDKKDIGEFIFELNRVTNDYVASLKYNDIDNFFPFVNYIKSDPNKQFSKMMEDYKPPYYAADTIGQATSVIEYILKNLPSENSETIKKHFFIAAARMGATAKTLEDMKTDSDKKKPYPNHVVAALKIIVGKTIGYIIIDPKYHVGQVVVVKTDTSSPQSKFKIQSGEKKYEFSIYKDDPSYIISKEVPQSSDGAIDIYYMKEAYCTFLDLTAKDEMLNFLRCMVTRSTTGEPVASVKIELLPTLVPETKLMGTFYYKHDTRGDLTLDIPLDAFIENDELNKAMTEEQGKHFANTYNKLKLFAGIKVFKKKIQDINNIYKTDNNILRLMSEMRVNSKYFEDNIKPINVFDHKGGQELIDDEIQDLPNTPLVKNQRKWYHRMFPCFFGGND